MDRPVATLLVLCALGAGCAGKGHDSETAETAEPHDSETGDTGGSSNGEPYTFVGGPSDAAGNAVALPGDMDGDGVPDVVVAAYYGNRVCTWSGAALDPTQLRHDLDSADVCYAGAADYDFSGYAISAAGDSDGDGRADLLVGAIGDSANGSNAGRAWILPGATFGAEQQLADAASGSLVGEVGSDYAGVSLTGGHDLTGDGLVDYLVGASGSDAGGAGGGKAYLVPGPVLGEVQLSSVSTTFIGLPVTTTTMLHGEFGGGDAVGNAVAMPGDVDGDGIEDLVLGASGADENGTSTGKVVVYYGPVAEGQHEITDADLTLLGPAAYSYAGSPVNAAGDADGDGYADVLVSADGVDSGTLFLHHGAPRGGANAVQSLDDETDRWTGEVSDDLAAFAVVTGDLDGDGQLDLCVAAPNSDRSGQDAGAVYVDLGPWASGTTPLASVDQVLEGEQVADAFGRSLASGQDVDGDGSDDLLVGAIYNDDGGAFSGKAYLY